MTNMKKCEVKAMKCYEGSEPYIFLSYAHKNTDMVMPVFRGLDKEGFRIWYGAGTEPGTEWPEYIAEHLERASWGRVDRERRFRRVWRFDIGGNPVWGKVDREERFLWL